MNINIEEFNHNSSNPLFYKRYDYPFNTYNIHQVKENYLGEELMTIKNMIVILKSIDIIDKISIV